MLTLLTAIRDFLIAAALAWVGISVETQVNNDTCAAEACETTQQR